MQTQAPETDVPTAQPGNRRLFAWGGAAWLIALAPIAAGTLVGGGSGGALAEAAVLGAILGLVAAAVFGITLRRRLEPDVEPSRRAKTALILGIGALVTVVAFWSGLPVVLGIAAVVLGAAAHRGEPNTRATVAMVLGGLAVAAGLGSSVSDFVNVTAGNDAVAISAFEYGYDVPDQVAGTTIEWELSNDGGELHEFGLVRLEDGRTIDDLVAALEAGDEPDWATDAAGVPMLSPGRSVTLERTLEESGTYALLCFLPSPDGVPHAALGMVETFEVTDEGGAELPEPDAVITATEDGLDIPEIEAGETVLEFRNDGQGLHEFWIIAFDEGTTDADVGAWFESGQEGPAPAEFVGGIQTIPGGTSVFQTIELEAGTTYTVMDYANEAEGTFTAR